MTSKSGVPTRPQGDKLRGKRVVYPGGPAAPGWTTTDKGGLAIDRPDADIPLYRTRQQTIDDERVSAAEVRAAAWRASELDRDRVICIVDRAAQSGESPTTDELKLISNTDLRDSGKHSRYADAARLARKVLESQPDAAYVAFESNGDLSSLRGDDVLRDHQIANSIDPLPLHTAVILNADFVVIDKVEDYRRPDRGYGSERDELDELIERVYRDGIDFEPELSPEARSFAGDSHPEVPDLLNLTTASTWVPARQVDSAPETKSLWRRLLGR